MASNADSLAAVAASTFTPKASVTVNVGRIPTDLYPRIDMDAMPVHERAHAFHVNMTAIANVDIDTQTQLDALGAQLNLSSIVEGRKADFINYYAARWMDFAHLRIQSFHNSAGAIIPAADCCLAADPSILKPVANGNYADVRPSDIKFVRVQLQLDFARLMTAPPPPGDPHPVTVLQAEYYMELPQSSIQLVNGGHQNYMLHSWLGADDLRTLSADQVRNLILRPCLRDSPILLATADFNLPGIVRTSSSTINSEIKSKILRLAFHQICSTLFQNLCPHYTDQPHAAVDVIKQSYIDADGNRISSSVIAYHHRMTLAMRPFIGNVVFPVSVCNKFMEGLDPRIRVYFNDRYPDHWKSHELEGAFQKERLHQIFLTASAAETQYKRMGETAREAIGQPIGQAYSASAYPSQAENTLARYDSSPSPSKSRKMGKGHKCFGCGSPDHGWKKEGVITCPKGHLPEIKQAAKENYEKFRKEARLRTREKGKSSPKQVSYADLDDDAKRKLAHEVFAAHGTDATSVASSVTSPSTNAASALSPTQRIHRTLFCSISEEEANEYAVLNSTAAPSCRVLPVPTMSAFPTIELPVGAPTDESFPAIKCIVDTAAGLNTGNIRYIAGLAKQYPNTLVRLYAPSDYRPIVLSGIDRSAKDEEHLASTELDCAFEFNLPFYGRDGSTVSIMIATGANVSVNSILGLPFLKGCGGIIDLVNDLVDLRHLDCPPFKFKFLSPTCYAPETSNAAPAALATVTPAHQRVIDEIDNLVAFVCGEVTPPAASRPSVSFQSTSATGPHQPVSAASSNGDPPVSIVRWTPSPSASTSFDSYYDPLLGNSDSSM